MNLLSYIAIAVVVIAIGRYGWYLAQKKKKEK